MRTKYLDRIWAVIAASALVTLACGLFVVRPPTAVPVQPPLQLSTSIPVVVPSPTTLPEPAAQDTSIPVPTTDLTPTEPANPVMTNVKDYYQKGYLPFENGQLLVLDDLSKTGMSLDVFDFTNTHQQAQNFALWADIELNSTGSTTYPNYTGCGFAYRVQSYGEGYTAFLTNEAVRMGACSSGFRQCTLFGTAYGFGTGMVDVPNGSKALFSLAVNKDRAWVLVDGKLVGQYTLYTTKLLGTGYLYYGSASNINAGYHTACQISNVRVWDSRP